VALAALPEPYREVILLRFFGDCSCSEVAVRLGIPLGTVTKRLSRAYRRERHALL
jgi:RNA polymerase sigma-70 factor, ECF subfamily